MKRGSSRRPFYLIMTLSSSSSGRAAREECRFEVDSYSLSVHGDRRVKWEGGGDEKSEGKSRPVCEGAISSRNRSSLEEQELKEFLSRLEGLIGGDSSED